MLHRNHFKLGRFENHHTEGDSSDRKVCVGLSNVSSLQEGLLAFEAFLPGCELQIWGYIEPTEKFYLTCNVLFISVFPSFKLPCLSTFYIRDFSDWFFHFGVFIWRVQIAYFYWKWEDLAVWAWTPHRCHHQSPEAAALRVCPPHLSMVPTWSPSLLSSAEETR